MIEMWRGGAIVTGAVAPDAGTDADADAEDAEAAPPDGSANAMRAERAAAATVSRGSSRAVGRSNIGSSVRGVSQGVKRSLSFLETSAWNLGERA
ncbi:MAG TPA: hypothetical protein VGH63_12460 [Polyangia bacterium]